MSHEPLWEEVDVFCRIAEFCAGRGTAIQDSAATTSLGVGYTQALGRDTFTRRNDTSRDPISCAVTNCVRDREQSFKQVLISICEDLGFGAPSNDCSREMDMMKPRAKFRNS